MKLREIYEIADGLAPFAISEEFKTKLGFYDNSGIMLDCGREICGVLFSLDLSARAVEEAKRAGMNCIFTHHPAIWNGITQIAEGKDGDTIALCVREGISVISAHLNLDAAKNGIDESLMRGLGGKEPLAVMQEVEGGGYGRVYDVRETSMNVFVDRVRQVFRTKRVVAYGNAPVSRVASFCGGGYDGGAIAFSIRHGADTIVSSDAKHHLITEAVEKGMNVILLTHYAAENFGFLRFAEAVKQQIGIPVAAFTDERYL